MDPKPLEAVTLIVPYYRNCEMLKRQLQEWEHYPPAISIIVVDDGSPEPARPIIETSASATLRERLQLYRIGIDIPWNREGARNLGAHVCEAEWIVHVDIDHILPAECTGPLLAFRPDPRRWYRFRRWRCGRADETRRKDAIPPEQEFGEIKPHIDSYLVRRSLYWQVGGYDEDYSGCLGGGNAFLRRLEAVAPVGILPLPIQLHVYTRSVVQDASDWSLSRDTKRGKDIFRRKQASGDTTPRNPLRFPWSREL